MNATPLAATPVHAEETVYFGSVYPLHAAAQEPAFVYERTVARRGGALVSTHVTRDPSGATAIHESATHSADYALASYALHADQRGRSGTVRVEGDLVSFELRDGARRRARVERRAGPIAVGPTLVGHLVRHLEALRKGEVLRVRLAVLERLATLEFELQAVEAEPGRTRVRMKPSSLLLRLAVRPILFTFETATSKLVRLEGRVPPKIRAGRRWRDLDARVEYRYVAGAYA